MGSSASAPHPICLSPHPLSPLTCALSGLERRRGAPRAGMRKRRVASCRALRMAET